MDRLGEERRGHDTPLDYIHTFFFHDRDGERASNNNKNITDNNYHYYFRRPISSCWLAVTEEEAGRIQLFGRVVLEAI